MKAIALYGDKKADIIEADIPGLLPGEVRIKIDCCLLCTYEQRLFQGLSGPIPVSPGHEAAGVIDAVHPDTITTFNVGDRVVFKTLDHCGHCHYCYTGQTNQCTGNARKRYLNGIPSFGGLSEYVNMDISRVFPVYGDIPLEHAAFTEPLACCIHSINRAGIEFGDTVVIIGAGIMGQLHTQLAARRGARVIVLEPDAKRAAMARSFGAAETIDPLTAAAGEKLIELTNSEGADVVFTTTRFTEQVTDAMGYLRKGGRLVLYGSFNPKNLIDFDPNGVHYSEIMVTGSYSPSTEDFYRAIRMLSYNLVSIAPLLSETYPMEAYFEAFNRSLQPDTYRVAIKIG